MKNHNQRPLLKNIFTKSLLCLCIATTTVYAEENTDKEPKDSDTAPAEVVPKSPHDTNAPTLADLQIPDDNELSQANTDLLAKNAELQGRIDELTTQVNVLVNERSGQLFLYGALSVLCSVVLGFFMAWLLLRDKKKADFQ